MKGWAFIRACEEGRVPGPHSVSMQTACWPVTGFSQTGSQYTTSLSPRWAHHYNPALFPALFVCLMSSNYLQEIKNRNYFILFIFFANQTIRPRWIVGNIWAVKVETDYKAFLSQQCVFAAPCRPLQQHPLLGQSHQPDRRCALHHPQGQHRGPPQRVPGCKTKH